MNKNIKKIMALTIVSVIIFQAQAMNQKEKNNKRSLEQTENFSKKQRIYEKKLEQEQLNQKFFHAAYNGKIQELEECLKAGINIETKDQYGRTAFILAAKGYQTNTLKFLTQNGANREAKNDDGETALVYTGCYGRRGYTNLAKFLINLGSNPFATNNDGLTPYELALKNNQDTIAYFFAINNEFTAFRDNPTNWTVAANAPKSAYVKIMMYNNKDNVYFIDLTALFAKFKNEGKNEQLRKILKECEFLQYSGKKELENMRKNGFPLTRNEFDMKANLSDHQQSGAFANITIE